MRQTLFAFLLASLCVLALPAAAQSAYVYAVHGIPGMNGFPVDVKVGSECVLKGFTFGTVAGPLALPAGSYTLEISAANAQAPCSNAIVLSGNYTLAAGKTYVVAAHLAPAAMPNHNPEAKLTAFGVDLSPPGPGLARLFLHHTAAAPAVDVTAFRGDGSPGTPAVTIPSFANGDQEQAALRPGNWRVVLSYQNNPVFGPTPIQLKPRTALLVFAAGVFPDTFTYIVKEIPLF
ncbi:MAG: DUF4397 domain-containing protein [Bryobacteraceae bacterium]|nr:DUF4397 domain-containing protein [Bryobacteraceae bacterium]